MEIIRYKDRDIETEEVQVLTSNEPWNEYQLANGAFLKMKSTLVRVYKATEEKNPDGSILYITRTNTIVDVKE